MLSPDGCLHYSRLILQGNNCRSFKGHNIMTDFPPLLVPRGWTRNIYFLPWGRRLAPPGLVRESLTHPTPKRTTMSPTRGIAVFAEVHRAGRQWVRDSGEVAPAADWGQGPRTARGPSSPLTRARDIHTSPQMKTLTVTVAASGTRDPGLWSPHG